MTVLANSGLPFTLPLLLIGIAGVIGAFIGDNGDQW
jgi:hypothetical protein